MNILFAIEVIHAGGAETFVLRLADAFQKQGHNVVVFVFYKQLSNEKLHKSLAPEVPVVYADIKQRWLLQKVDGLLFRLKIDKNLTNKVIKEQMVKTIKLNNIDVIHSHLLKADVVSLAAAGEINKPVVATIHGDYLQYHTKLQRNIPIYLLNYATKAKDNLKKLRQIVCISDKQINFFGQQFAVETKNNISKIYNGYAKPWIKSDGAELKNKLGIKPDDFVFGMISRGIPEKGWELAIKAFLQLKNSDTHLVLIGSGIYLDELKGLYSSANIHFIGHSNEPLEWLNIFDVGLLPSTYASESLPTVIIEYLACGKPVIASDAGEINNMLQSEGKLSGIIIPIKNNQISIEELNIAMSAYIRDKTLYESHKANTADCFELFDMDKCVNAYSTVYNKAIGS